MSINTFLGGLAGLAGGASQGLQQVQENKQRQLQMQLQQRQQQMVEEDRKRRAVMEARQMLSGGMKVQPEQIQEWSQFPEALTGIEKQEDGTFLVAKSPSERQMDLVIQDLERKGKENQDRMAALEQWNAGAYKLPIPERYALWSKIGDKNIPLLLPEEELEHSERLAAEEIKKSAAIARATAGANLQTELAKLRFAQQGQLITQRNQLTYADAYKLAQNMKDPTGMLPQYKTPEELHTAAVMLMQQAQQNPPQASSQSTGQSMGIARNLRRVQ